MQYVMLADYSLAGLRPRTRSTQRAICFTHALLLLSLAVIGCATSLDGLDAAESLSAASLAFVALSGWTLWSWYKLSGTLMDPYGFFLMSSWTFNGGQVFLNVLQLNVKGLLGGVFTPLTLLKAEYLVALGMCALHMGALWAYVAASRRLGAGPQQSLASRDLAWHTRWVGWFLLALSIGPAVWVLWNASEKVVAGGYMALYQTTLETGLAGAPAALASFLMPAGLFLLAGSQAKRTGVVVSAMVVGCGAATMFYLGDRGTAASALVAYVWLYSRTIRPIPAKLLILPALVLAFVVFPLIHAIRDTRGTDRSSIDFMWSTWSTIDNPAIGTLSEMGGSMATVAYTLDLVPSARPFDYGASYAFALLTAFPNVAWDVHPTFAHGVLSQWLVRTVNPTTAQNGGGLGYSFIAEVYANFGWLGVPFVLLALGWIVGNLSEAVRHRGDAAILALGASLLLSLLMYARAETADLVRSSCWYAIMPYLLVRLLSGVRK